MGEWRKGCGPPNKLPLGTEESKQAVHWKKEASLNAFLVVKWMAGSGSEVLKKGTKKAPTAADFITAMSSHNNFQEQPNLLTSLVGYLFDLQKSAEELLVPYKDPHEDSQRHVCASNEKETSKPCIAHPSRELRSSEGQELELFHSVLHLQLTQLANFKQQGAQGASSRRPKQVRWSDGVASHTNSNEASKSSSVRTSLAMKHAEAAAGNEARRSTGSKRGKATPRGLSTSEARWELLEEDSPEGPVSHKSTQRTLTSTQLRTKHATPGSPVKPKSQTSQSRSLLEDSSYAMRSAHEARAEAAAATARRQARNLSNAQISLTLNDI